MTRIQIKRVYEPATEGDGARFFVERLWPRGIAKADLRCEGWLRELAPSHELRRWYGHDRSRWPEFRNRYRAELQAHSADWRPLVDRAAAETITLLIAARDVEHSSAAVLRDVLEHEIGRGTPHLTRRRSPRRDKRRTASGRRRG